MDPNDTLLADWAAMDPNDIPRQTLDRISKLDAMNRWIVDMIRPHVGRRILEVGCGIGNLTGSFLGRELLVSIDIRDEYVRTVRDKFRSDDARFKSLRLDIAADPVDDLRVFGFDTVICLNVLEHIEHDVGALRKMLEVLRPGGRLLLLVPALRALYGTLDVHVEHYRRYERRELVAKLHQSGFSVERVVFMHLAGALGWWLNSRILKARILPEKQIGVYDRLVPLFRWVEERVPPPVGLSLVAIARKPE